MKSLIFFASLFLLQIHSNAQNRVGNGGNGVICLGSQKKAEILDFYESHLKLVDSKEDYMDLLKNRIAKLNKIHPELARVFEKRSQEISDEIEWKRDIELTEVKDSKELFRPKEKDCQIRQAVIRRNSVLVGQKRFLFDQNIWEQLSEISKAGLVMHEIVYEHFFKLGEMDSVKARAFNVWIFSKDFEQIDKEEYWKYIRSMKIPIYRGS